MSTVTIGDVAITSRPAEVLPTRDEQLARVEIALLGTILALALLGNGMMAGVLRRISLRRKLTRMNRMMVHLTVADIFVAVCHVLPQVYSFITPGIRPHLPQFSHRSTEFQFRSKLLLVSPLNDRY